ncbi:MAG: histidine phosphatase family protein [Bacteroidota bacterium]
MTKDIYLIRHGETVFNKLGIVQGSGVDTDLNETGQQQANAFYEMYKEVPFEIVLTSKLKRTHQTVQPFTDKGLAWEQFREINEMSWGEHEGKEYTPERKVQYTAITSEWDKENYDVGMKGGETINELAARCRKFVNQLRQRAEQTILICAHGRLNRCLLCVLLDIPLKHMNDFSHSNTGLNRLQFDGEQFELLTQNDTEHLKIKELTAI